MAAKYKQQSDGRWHTKVWDGTYKGGRKHYVSFVSAKSSKDLEKIVTEYEQKRDNGLLTVSQAISIQEYGRVWLKAEKGLSESATKEMYRNIIETHLKDFSGIPFEYLTRQNIQMLINENVDKPRTCQQISITLKQICKSAERDKLLPFGKTAELFDRIQLPKYKAEEKQPLTDEQCSVVYDTLLTHKLPPRSSLFLSLIYFCGLRREEALALKIDDIHSFSVSVNKAVHVGPNDTELKDTKTERGFREVPLPPEAMLIIQGALLDLQPNAEGFLFVMEDGRLITKSSYRRMWEGIEKALGFKCTAHIFRHTYCTKLCYEAFENRTITTKQIAKLLGDTEKMVTDVYGHLVDCKERPGKALANIFNHKKSAVNQL